MIAEAEALTADISHGILHGDPAPEAFLVDRNEVGLIDWGAAVHGPLLYDLASAYIYSGPGVVSGYRRTGPLPTTELEHLDLFRRFRLVVQAWYFSWRIATNGEHIRAHWGTKVSFRLGAMGVTSAHIENRDLVELDGGALAHPDGGHLVERSVAAPHAFFVVEERDGDPLTTLTGEDENAFRIL